MAIVLITRAIGMLFWRFDVFAVTRVLSTVYPSVITIIRYFALWRWHSVVICPICGSVCWKGSSASMRVDLNVAGLYCTGWRMCYSVSWYRVWDAMFFNSDGALLNANNVEGSGRTLLYLIVRSLRHGAGGYFRNGQQKWLVRKYVLSGNKWWYLAHLAIVVSPILCLAFLHICVDCCLRRLLDELLFESTSVAGSITSEYLSLTMLRAWAIIFMANGLVPDCTGNCLLIDRLACCTPMRKAVHTHFNLLGARQRGFWRVLRWFE